MGRMMRALSIVIGVTRPKRVVVNDGQHKAVGFEYVKNVVKITLPECDDGTDDSPLIELWENYLKYLRHKKIIKPDALWGLLILQPQKKINGTVYRMEPAHQYTAYAKNPEHLIELKIDFEKFSDMSDKEIKHQMKTVTFTNHKAILDAERLVLDRNL